MEFVTLVAFDGSLVRVPVDKVEEFNTIQQSIKNGLNSGKSMEEILTSLK